MLFQRFHKTSPVCKLLLQMHLVASIKSECFTLWGIRPISSTATLYTSGTGSSLPCAGSRPATRFSPVARNEAQDALYDYLHCTRGLYTTDAEHISKNSPTFLRHLLSKVKKEQHVRQSLVRYLRYHPINEFEPFFESIGLKPFQFLSLLPPKLMFLSDDIPMLEVFHVLCNYGVPRNKIGKIYKEAGAVFKFDPELLRTKLMSYENIVLSKSIVIKLIASFPGLLIGDADKNFACVWKKLKTLGIDHEWILAYLDEKKTYHWNRMIRILDFFGSMGCSDVDLAKFLKNHPRFFFDDSGNRIFLAVALLLKSGLTMSEVLGLLLCYPKVLVGRFAKKLWEAVHFLCEIGLESEEVRKIVKSHTQILGSHTLLKPKYAAVRLKMDMKTIRGMIKEDPNELRRFAATRKRKRSLIVNLDSKYPLEKTSFMLKMGFVENSEEMMKALKRCVGRGDQLQERFDCLVNAGLEFDAAALVVRRAPSLLSQSRDVIEKKIDFLINSLGQPIEYLVTFPNYLRFDIARTALRVKMFDWLKEKGLGAPKLAPSSLIAMSDERFIKRHVSHYPGGLKQWERLKRLSS